MSIIRDYETMVHGDENNNEGMREVVSRVLEEAKAASLEPGGTSLIRMEIRSTPLGIPSSAQECNVRLDASVTTVEAVLQAIVARLNESPGEVFSGKLRINFFKAGSSDKYGTFTRNVQCGLFSEPEGQPEYHRARAAMERRESAVPIHHGSNGGGHDYNGDDGDLGDADTHGRARPPETGINPHDNNFADDVSEAARMKALMSMPSMNHGGGGDPIVTAQQARAWIELYASLNFRQQAQMIVMFERTMRFMENFALRYGAPEMPMRNGIQDAPPQNNRNPAPEGLGFLPMLLSAAAQLAGSDNPAEAIKNAASLAEGQPPKHGAARALAVRGANELVRGLGIGGGAGGGTGASNRRGPGAAMTTPARPKPGYPPVPSDHGGSGRTFDDDLGYVKAPAHQEEVGVYGDGPTDAAAFDSGSEAPFDPGTATEHVERQAEAFDPTALSTDQMREMVVNWLRADPSRKGEVMKMVPDLMKEVT